MADRRIKKARNKLRKKVAPTAVEATFRKQTGLDDQRSVELETLLLVLLVYDLLQLCIEVQVGDHPVIISLGPL